MPKRIIWFLVVIAMLALWTLLAPMATRSSLEASTPNGIPNASPYGYRGLYMLMSRLTGKPTRFWQHSMMRLPASPPQTVWFIEPGENMFLKGKTYDRQMQALVKKGAHFIFVLDSNSAAFYDKAGPDDVSELTSPWAYLKTWYGIDPKRNESTLGSEGALTVAVRDAFTTRDIHELVYEPIDPSSFKLHATRDFSSNPPQLVTLDRASLGIAKPLLWRQDGAVLAASYPYGLGRVTVFPDATFFKNGMLGQGDNASLALALQEMTPGREAVFEGYSQGFADRKDVLTALATGSGMPFLMSVVLLLVLGSWWLACQPVRYRPLRSTENETRFTQETFIDAMATHYKATGRWGDLYDRLRRHFVDRLERRYGGVTPAQRIEMIARNPFNTVSQDALESVLSEAEVRSEADFTRRSRQLLAVEQQLDLTPMQGASAKKTAFKRV